MHRGRSIYEKEVASRFLPAPAAPSRLFPTIVLSVPSLALPRTLLFRIVRPVTRRPMFRTKTEKKRTRQQKLGLARSRPSSIVPGEDLRDTTPGSSTHASVLLPSYPTPPRAPSLGPPADRGGLLSLSLSPRSSRRAGDRDLSRSFPDRFLGGVSGESDRLSRSPCRWDEDGSRGSLPLATRRSALSWALISDFICFSACRSLR